MCADYLGLNCLNEKCFCNSSMYYNSTLIRCVGKKLMNDSCGESYECDESKQLFCSKTFLKCIECPTSWKIDSNYCYYYSNNLALWDAANNFCMSYGGNLLNIRTLEDYDYFKNVFDGKEFWIGLNYRIGIWSWYSDGSIFNDTYNWWGTHEPSLNDDCVRISRGFKFYGRPCSSYFYESVCQII
jgi:hypothetical protein